MELDLSTLTTAELEEIVEELQELITAGKIDWESKTLTTWMLTNNIWGDHRLLMVSTVYPQRVLLTVAQELLRRIQKLERK